MNGWLAGLSSSTFVKGSILLPGLWTHTSCVVQAHWCPPLCWELTHHNPSLQWQAASHTGMPQGVTKDKSTEDTTESRIRIQESQKMKWLDTSSKYFQECTMEEFNTQYTVNRSISTGTSLALPPVSFHLPCTRTLRCYPVSQMRKLTWRSLTIQEWQPESNILHLPAKCDFKKWKVTEILKKKISVSRVITTTTGLRERGHKARLEGIFPG